MKRTITPIDPRTRRPTGTRIVEVQNEYDTFPPDCYGTPDLGLAAYLRSHGIHLRTITLRGRRATFVFEDADFCLELARRWINDEDTEVQATVYSRELSKLKAAAARGGF